MAKTVPNVPFVLPNFPQFCSYQNVGWVRPSIHRYHVLFPDNLPNIYLRRGFTLSVRLSIYAPPVCQPHSQPTLPLLF
jgi:hypothetical protein